MDNCQELTKKIILVDSSGEDIRGFNKATEVAAYLSCEVRRVYVVLKQSPFEAKFKGHYVAHSRSLPELLGEVTRSTIETYVKAQVRANHPPVIVYDENGKYVASKDTVADVAVYLGKPQSNIHRAKKEEFAHYTVNGHFIRDFNNVLDENGNVKLQLNKGEMADPSRVISLYNAIGELIKTFSTPKELAAEIGIEVTQVNKLTLRGELIIKDINSMYFTQRGYADFLDVVINDKSRTIKLWKITSIKTGDILLSTTSVNEVAEYLDISTNLVYNSVKNMRVIAGSFRIHQTELPNLKIKR